MANLTIGTVWKFRGKREIHLPFQTVSLKCCRHPEPIRKPYTPSKSMRNEFKLRESIQIIVEMLTLTKLA